MRVNSSSSAVAVTPHSTRVRQAFRPVTIVGLLLVGTLAFLLLLFALGKGWTGQSERDGGAHAASNSLNGFSALADLLERRGHDVALSRSRAAFDDEVLLVLTPSQFADGEELWEAISARRYIGPTLLVLPKWFAIPLPTDNPQIETREGWVQLGGTSGPMWLEDLQGLGTAEVVRGRTDGWKGLGLSGTLPVANEVQALTNEDVADILPIISDREDDVLAGVIDDGGNYLDLFNAAGLPVRSEASQSQDEDEDAWPVVVVFEPDLLNNYGLADETRARAAIALVDATLDGFDLPISFDLTLPGLGASENLLTLAFTPPFLAATLCLLLLALVIAWRALRRFGATQAEAPATARGKEQLARNGARLVERAKRWHLLGEPYAALVASRVAKALGIRSHDRDSREAAIDHALQIQGSDLSFVTAAATLRGAGRPSDILRAARTLRTIERTLSK